MKSRKSQKIKKFMLCFSLMVTLVLGSVGSAYAASVTSSMSIRGHQYNTYSAESATRKTTNSNNAWRIQLTSSTEKQGTVTSFWLVNGNATGTTLSKKIDVKKGSGWNDCVPYSAANSSNGVKVKIGAENNTWNSETYDITCDWVAQAS